jgi:predicted DNA-binding protein with PD1-like motif
MSNEKAQPIGRYKASECRRGREWVFRVTTGDDVYLAVMQFIKDNNVRFAKIHALVMGGLEPTNYMVWAFDPRDPANWHYEAMAAHKNLTMLLAMGGIIHQRQLPDGSWESFPAIHFVAGGSWDGPVFGGHLKEGTIAKGNVTFFITEILGLESIPASEQELPALAYTWYVPENRKQ